MKEVPKRRLPLVQDASTSTSSDAGKRRLPVLQGSTEPENEERPPWHWAALGTVGIFLVWLPLAMLVNTLVRRMLEGGEEGMELSGWTRVAVVGVNALAFGLASFAGGLLVGRFGGRAKSREATASGLIAAATAWLLAVTQGVEAGILGWMMLLGVMASMGSGAAYTGGRVGLRMRRRAEGRSG